MAERLDGDFERAKAWLDAQGTDPHTTSSSLSPAARMRHFATRLGTNPC